MAVKYYIYMVVLATAALVAAAMYNKGYSAGYDTHRKEVEQVARQAADTSLVNTEVLSNEEQKERKDLATDECVSFREFHYYTKCVRPANR